MGFRGQPSYSVLNYSFAGRSDVGSRKLTSLGSKVMVTHNWDNLFSHLVAAIVAAALGHYTFES